MYNRKRKQRYTATATKTAKKIVNRSNREKCDVTLPWWQKFWMTTMKSLSKDDGENNENGKKSDRFSKITTLHMHHAFF